MFLSLLVDEIIDIIYKQGNLVVSSESEAEACTWLNRFGLRESSSDQKERNWSQCFDCSSLTNEIFSISEF